ncbi:hypothetical protein HIR71_12970 [Cellulomonas fimi]|uniref:Uncharacterized protein n=1 Tax=Cellulomonas fimi TaxID=1708 RepID=A0A7Y0M136_CELFI|nr:hypothetical protein [Cellulomonas fimi]
MVVAALTVLLGTAPGWAAPAPAAVDDAGAPLLVIGTSGLRWDDVGALTTPALWGLSRTAAVGTVAVRSLRPFACPADGWLALSAGARAADLDGATYGECRTLREPMPDGRVAGWADFVQSASEADYDARLGLLGDTLAAASPLVPGASAPAAGAVVPGVTGIGPGAAIALADADGLPVGTHVRLPREADELERTVETALRDSQLVVLDVGAVRDPGQRTVARPASGLDEDGDGRPDPGATPTPEPPTGSEEDLTAPDAVTEPTRSDQVREIDARIGAALAAVEDSGRDVTVLVASLADSGRSPHLQLAAASGPSADPGAAAGPGAAFAEALLESRSTRQPGYVMTTDLTPTVLSALGIRGEAPAGALVGSVITAVPGPELASQRVAAMIDEDRHAWAVRPLVPVFFTFLIVVNLLLYAFVTLGLNGHVLASLSSGLNRVLPGRAGRAVAHGLTSRPRLVLSLMRMAGVAVASIPVATFLANLSPWWRLRPPSYALIALVVVWVAVLTALALVPRWKSWLLGPVGVVAGATALVIAADIATGGGLQISALMGVQPLVGARFYGFNNQAFALFAASTILLAVAVANPLVRRGRRRQAAAAVAGIGVVATVLDGMPGLGSDFGGPPAMVPGFAVLALLAAGIRLTWRRALGVLAAGAAVVVGFALVDWMRPADSQTHLGRFVQTVLDGGLWPVVARKASQNLDNLFGSTLTFLAIAGIALVVLVLGRPLRGIATAPDGGPFAWLSSGAPLTQLGTDAPMLRPGLVALAVTLGIGFALNDSGIVIPAVGISVVVPLVVAACAGWMLGVRPATPATPVVTRV